ncbi:hypothetical protein Ancab_004678, partial [Ancistrocladus abbreviatus]
NPHKICPRDVVNATGINEELQNSSVSKWVFDAVRALRDLAHEVGDGEDTSFWQSSGRDVGCTKVYSHGSDKMGLGLVNKRDDNMGLLLYSEDNHNKEMSTVSIGPQTKLRGCHAARNCLKLTKDRNSKITQSGPFKKKRKPRKGLVEDILQL